MLENNPRARGCFRHAERRLRLGEQLLRKVEVGFNFQKPMTTAFRSKEAFSQKDSARAKLLIHRAEKRCSKNHLVWDKFSTWNLLGGRGGLNIHFSFNEKSL